MFLKRFVFINWGNIPSIDFEFGPLNLFSGGNGSGKTTAADAIQTVMTAAHESLFQYNPGQDETTQRGRGGKRVRTLASYVLGCDDGSYARLDPTDGYVAAVFQPNEGEPAEPFTAVIGVRAWLDIAGGNTVARQDDAQYFIVPGAELALGDFVREEESGRYVVALSELQTELIRMLGKRRVERYDAKKAYLRRLYGALRGKPDSVTETEAVAAARAFSRFMAYKPVKSIDRFVAEEILEPKDLGEAIRSVSSQLKTIHGMERDASRLLASIDTLARANAHAQAYIDHWIDLNLLDYTLAQAEYGLRQQDYLRGKALQREQRAEQAELEARLATVQTQTVGVQRQLIELEAQRQGVDALRQKDEIERQSQALGEALVEGAHRLVEQDRTVAANVEATRTILRALDDPSVAETLPGPSASEAQALGRAVVETAGEMLADVHALVQRDIAGGGAGLEQRLEALLAVQRAHNRWHALWHAARESGSARDRLMNLAHAARARYGALAHQRDEKRREIERLGANLVSYPPAVERALKAIRQQCPEADPRVLCDHVEVRDARWQAAIEGYLGGARFSILVAPDHEAQAIRIVRALPGRDNRARVIQGHKAAEDAARIALDTQSIIHVLEFSHAVARHYLVASYGSVVRVESAEALRGTRRGVTDDGMASGNYSMWRCDMGDADLVFGAAARARALTAKHAELEAIEIEWHAAGDQIQQAAALLQAVDRVAVSAYGDVLRDVLATRRALDENESRLARLDLSEHQDLEQRLQALQAEYAELSTEKDRLNEHKGKLGKELEDTERQLKALDGLQNRNRETVAAREADLAAIAPVWPDFALEARLETADREARELNIEFSKQYRQELERNLHTAERRLAEAVLQHNQDCRPSDAIVYAPFSGEYGPALFQSVCEVRRELDRVHNLLRNNILVEKHAQLAELKDAFNNAFVSHLCHAIYQALNEGRRQIDLLNKELQHHRFGADREVFRFASEWVPEYRDYSRFFEEVVRTPGLGDEVTLFDAQLSERSRGIRDRLMAMLLDEDEQRAVRELERIADYRNYRRYEIYKEVAGKAPIPLSEYGTGSGGQLETPAYIIRSAAITSAFRFAEGAVHLRMVLVDEAFSKMDEARSREVIQYLAESLGLQLIFIMPTSKCGPYLDLISNEFVFAKVPSEAPRGQLSTRVLVDRKQCNRARIEALWKRHRHSVYQQAELDFMEAFGS
ncbi:ATP-binding protein [Acidihalobacter prosperus]|uniref:Uncharacterized protein n=1 Tax=Acidihalobacter prosperus TaxID=160660 RepID=A0A1A6C8V4_9GAMM|nr:SbcC/MukB-like Walker B domain-containing protein [Acidihalobacter prosperus]OBS10980.1 hypothetical protein Thpro_020696 [Acidihalobacter prosperus]